MLDKAMAELLMNAIKGADVIFDEPMSAHTSLGIGGPAELLVRPHRVEAVAGAVWEIQRLGLPIAVLGGGTNVLVRDTGIGGAVLDLAGLDTMCVVEDTADHVTLQAGAGLALQRLVAYTRTCGLAGMEGLVGIPGRLGGAIAGNAGSFGSEACDRLVDVTILDQGLTKVITRDEITPSYRRTVLPGGAIILSATFMMPRGEAALVASSMDDNLARKKRTQPLRERSAGSVFKNPPSGSAARMLDELGLKGRRIGGIEISPVHAGFFVNTGGGSADDFMRLMELAAGMVERGFGITLEPEIKVLG